jgi:hypothetical protein
MSWTEFVARGFAFYYRQQDLYNLICISRFAQFSICGVLNTESQGKFPETLEAKFVISEELPFHLLIRITLKSIIIAFN